MTVMIAVISGVVGGLVALTVAEWLKRKYLWLNPPNVSKFTIRKIEREDKHDGTTQ